MGVKSSTALWRLLVMQIQKTLENSLDHLVQLSIASFGHNRILWMRHFFQESRL